MKYTELAKKLIDQGWAYIGVRALCPDEEYEIGDTCRESYEWDVEHDCSTYDLHGEDGEKAGGTCCTAAATWSDYIDDPAELAERIEKAIQRNRAYGSRQVIIAGNRVDNDGMLDPGEIRIVDAVVVGIVE